VRASAVCQQCLSVCVVFECSRLCASAAFHPVSPLSSVLKRSAKAAALANVGAVAYVITARCVATRPFGQAGYKQTTLNRLSGVECQPTSVRGIQGGKRRINHAFPLPVHAYRQFTRQRACSDHVTISMPPLTASWLA